MTVEGVVVGGRVEFETPLGVPDGTKVQVDVPERWSFEENDRETELAILRESIADAKAGRGGVEARAFLRQLAIDHNLPLLPGE